MKKLLITLSLTLSIIVSPLLSVSSALASTAVGFKAGEIMDDTVMTDYNSMTQTDIQNFLNSKVPICDTNGTQPLDASFSASGVPDYNHDGTIQRWEWGKAKYNQTTFPCLRNYTQNSQTSAQIIYNVSQQFHINPKVLIVLLQKEQGLVTDTWPLSIQYKTATGYACPDNGTCDTKYYGLTQQLTWAATMFHTIVTNNQTWSNAYGSGTSWYVPYALGNNSIYWNPSTSCGTSTVNIVNRTTVALYSYTPYRPNQASLDAGYGSGNSCSSYGNRNFYLYFTDWFGSTTIPMFKIGNSATLYLSYGNYYYGIPSQSILRAWGLGGKKITTVSSSQISSYTQGPNLGLIAKFGASSTTYLVDNGSLYPAPNWATLNAYGFVNGNDITYPDTNLMSMLHTKGSLTKLARQSSGAIYYVDSDKRHGFPDMSTFSAKASALAGTTQYSTFSDDLINSLSVGYPIYRDGVTVKESDGAAIVLYDNGKIRPFTPDSWRAWGRKLDYSTNTASLTQIPVGGNVPLLITDGTSHFVVANGKKYPFTSGVESSWGLTVGDFQSMTNSSLGRLGTGQNVGTLVRQPNGAVSLISGSKLYGIPSLQDFSKLGYQWSDVINVSNSVVSLISNGGDLVFAPGSLIRTPNGAISLIDENFNSYGIPSLHSFSDFGFQWANVRNFGSNALSGYTSQTLQNLIDTPTNKHYLADRGHLFTVNDTTYGSTEYNFSAKPASNLSDNLVAKLNIAGVLTQFIQGSGAVYKVINGQKCPISSPQSLYNNGGSWQQVTKVSDAFLNTLPTGSTLWN